MNTLWRLGSAIARTKCAVRPSLRSYSTNGKVFLDGDHVIIREGRGSEKLIKLRANETLHDHRGIIPHNDIIGKGVRDIVKSKADRIVRLQEPTLAEYVRLTRRIAAPLYGYDASTIVSLLDLHVPSPESPRLEILEAGTGHGSLTLHLSRAIHAANPPKPRAAPISQTRTSEGGIAPDGQNSEDSTQNDMFVWKKSRRAVIHTIDINEQHSKHAEKIVGGFRHGLYEGAVDFHIGDVSKWITNQLEIRGSSEPFLDYVILDLASAEDHLLAVSRALRPGGLLAVFNPSITQIVDVEAAMSSRALGFSQSQIVELAPPRLWEVYITQPRIFAKKAAAESKNIGTTDKPLGMDSSSGPLDDTTESTSQEALNEHALEIVSNTTKERVSVARPRFYGRTSGNGFLGLWYMMRNPKPTKTDTKTANEHV